jgi:hypothetical protein
LTLGWGRPQTRPDMGRLLDSLRGVMRSVGAKGHLDQLGEIDQAGASDRVEDLLEQSVQGAEIDPNDPDFAPVDGVDIDQYAHICKDIVDAGQQTDETKFKAILAEHKIERSAWTPIAETWNERVMRNPKVKMRYTATFLGQ